jgi:hypothetical protein
MGGMKTGLFATVTASCLMALPSVVNAQNLLANPSFENAGSP